MNPLRLLILFFTVLAAAGLTGCGGDPVSAVEGAKSKIFLVNNKAEPRFLDLQRCNSVTEHHIMLSLYQGLVGESKESDKDVEPGAAERWDTNADKSVWTFHLRKNAKWSDGAPLTAQDFVWSYRRMLRKALGAQYAEMLYMLKNGRELYDGVVKEEDLGARALDNDTLELTFLGPTPHFLLIACHTSWWPVPRHVIEKYGGVYDVMNPWTDEDKLVGNGPFKMKRYLFRQYLEVERNPHYWDAANVKLDGVRFYSIDDDAVEERLFRRGQLHATYSTPLSRIPDYLKNHPDIVQNYTNCASWYFRVNTTRPVLSDVKVRRALAFALDRKSIIDNVLRARQQPAAGMVPPMEGYTQVNEFSYDLTKARQLLAEAGFADGKGFPKFDILISKNEASRQIAEAVQAMWRQNLGISVGVTQQDFSVYLTSQQKLDYDIAWAGWNADYFDPASFIDMWMTDGGNNETGWSNKAFDKLLDDARQCADAGQRLAILTEAEKILMQDTPVLPLYFGTRTRLIHPAVKNWQARLLDNPVWHNLELISPPPHSSMDAELNRN
ncbi:MAG: transporter substrate-binding protein [Verrucomicrobiales bacterium]|nr:transporter substrate-binding protein [Verrucomicrobiales bacterium]